MGNFDPTGVYILTSGTILFLAAKDYVLLQIWTLIGKLCDLVFSRISGSSVEKSTNDKESSTRRKKLISCKEVSDLVLSQLLAWTALYILILTPALSCAFMTSASKVLDLVDLVMSVLLGRTLFQAFFNGFVHFHPVLFIHYSILSLCYASFLCPGASTAIGLIGAVCGIADIHQHVGRLMDIWKVPCYAKGRVVALAIGLVAAVVGRCLMPLALIILAICLGSPVSLNSPGLALFFFFLTYMAAINIFLTVTTTSAFKETIQLRQLYKSAQQESGRTLEFALAMKNANIRFVQRQHNPKTDQAILAIA